jgi:hypothetical protein
MIKQIVHRIYLPEIRKSLWVKIVFNINNERKKKKAVCVRDSHNLDLPTNISNDYYLNYNRV